MLAKKALGVRGMQCVYYAKTNELRRDGEYGGLLGLFIDFSGS